MTPRGIPAGGTPAETLAGMTASYATTTTCEQCFALVHSSELDRHQEWHDHVSRRSEREPRVRPARAFSPRRSRSGRPGTC